MGRERATRDVFRGAILGVGTSSGVRVVIGRWQHSPFGAFSDVMLAEPDGSRWLLAPDDRVAAYVGATYRFDRVTVGPVRAAVSGHGPWHWHVGAPGLDLRVEVGERGALGRLLGLVPRALATAPAFTLITDPVARVVQRGVRTRGTARGGRREFYAAFDLHPVVAAAGEWQGQDLGSLCAVAPEPGFGFGSTPTRPSVTSLTTTVVRLRENDIL